MKEDTKKLIVLGGLGAVGLYFLTRDSEDGYVGGGFGGGGGIPLLPGDTDDAAEEDSFLDALKNLLKTPDEPTIWAEEGMDREEYIKKYIHPEDRPPLMKEKMTIETYLDIVPPGEYAEGVPLADPTRVYGGVGGIKKTAQTAAAQTPVADESKPWYAPWTWNWEEAAKNYQEWATASTERTIDTKDIKTFSDSVLKPKKTIESRSVVSAWRAKSVSRGSMSFRDYRAAQLESYRYAPAGTMESRFFKDVSERKAAESTKKDKSVPGKPDYY